ncbi:T6SS immunity protein Tli4 family protein [Massilia sp. DD77]|uniref:T6SS immunity protein Tli4 family protein n=1 Tax=Massilia sp. DD77 TaxID=3109349 RepID=UPI0030003F95
MKPLGSVRNWVVIGLVMAIVVSAWGHSAMRIDRDNAKVRAMMQKTKTVCVGRFLIELPENAKVRFGTPQIAGVTINVEPEYSDERLRSDIEEREKKLRGEKNEYGSPSLEKKMIVEAVNFESTLLYFARTKPLELIEYGKPVKGKGDGITVEGLGIKNGNFYRFFADDLASPQNEDNVLDIAKKFEARSNDGIPSKPGFCIKNGLVHDPLTPDDNEMITMFVSLEGYPDIVIRLDTSINVDDMVESLFEREAKNDIKRDYASHFKSLRYGKRTLNGIEGEEVGDKIKELNGTSAHSFMWVGLGKMRDVLAPSVTLELHTGRGRPGEPRNSSLSDEAVLQLWDRISSSLRIRPTSPTAAVAAVPLGELVPTGSPCPQTGYWECVESGEVEGDPRRFFKKDEQMSHATVRAESSLWQKFRGDQPVRRLRTTWKLVAYEAIPVEQVETRHEQPVGNLHAGENRLQGAGSSDGPGIADSGLDQA